MRRLGTITVAVFFPLAVAPFTLLKLPSPGVSFSRTSLDASNPKPFALLVDAENGSPGSFDVAMNELRDNLGIDQIPIRRIYGKVPILQQTPWQTIILDHSFLPCYVAPGGLADMDMVIDAMDILYTKEFVQGFILFSSDADFGRLVQRLRENNLQVVGVGQRFKANSSQSLAKVCHQYIYTEDLETNQQQEENQSKEQDNVTSNQVEIRPAAAEEEEAIASPTEEQDERKNGTRSRVRKMAGLFASFVSNRIDKAAASDAYAIDNSEETKTVSPDASPSEGGEVSGMVVPETSPVETIEEDVPSPRQNTTLSSNELAAEKLVQNLKKELKKLAPNNEWVYMAVLAAQPSCDLKDTIYKKWPTFIRDHSEHFELKLTKQSAYMIRLRKQ